MDMGVIVNNLAFLIGEHLPCFLGDGNTSEIIANLQNLYKFQIVIVRRLLAHHKGL